MSDSKSSSGGVGFTGLLTIAFVVLKLCKVIDWPWWWVISPIWISIALILLALGGTGLYYFIQTYNLKKQIELRNREEQAEITNLKNKADELTRQIKGVPESKWQQRMNELELTKRQER